MSKAPALKASEPQPTQSTGFTTLAQLFGASKAKPQVKESMAEPTYDSNVFCGMKAAKSAQIEMQKDMNMDMLEDIMDDMQDLQKEDRKADNNPFEALSKEKEDEFRAELDELDAEAGAEQMASSDYGCAYSAPVAMSAAQPSYEAAASSNQDELDLMMLMCDGPSTSSYNPPPQVEEPKQEVFNSMK